MSIQVKFFASLREELGISERLIDLPAGSTADDAWRISTDGRERNGNILIAINMEYKDATSEIREGDEVAFFPPVTGG